jgi:hypothetical protein
MPLVFPTGCGWGDGIIKLMVTDVGSQTATVQEAFRLNYVPPPN